MGFNILTPYAGGVIGDKTMIINKLEMTNFCGYKGSFVIDFPKTGILMGHNGIGKTSVLNAVRYALTGDKPDGDIVNKDASQASVTLTLENEEGGHFTLTRVERRGKANVCYMGKQKITKKALATWIEDFIKLPLDKVKIISSAEVLAALSDADFGKFLLTYVGKKTPLTDVIGWLDGASDGAKDILDANMPAEIGIENLDELDFYLRDSRKSLKKEVSSLEAQIKALPDAPEGVTRESIKAELDALKKADTDYQVYLAKKAGYEKMVNMISSQKTKAEELKAKIAANTAVKPDEAVKESITADFNSAKQSYDNNRTAWTSQQSGKAALDKEIAALSNPGVCPLSRHVTCHEDMTAVKAELEAASAKMTEGMNALVAECNKAAEQMKVLQTKASEWQKNANAYAEKETLKKELTAISETAQLPEKPAEVTKPDTAAREAELNSLLRQIQDAEKKVSLTEELTKKKAELSDDEYLIKAISDKGIIRKNIVSSFSVFEDECNKKCEGTPFTFRFSFDKGVVPEMKNAHGTYLKASELSGGEKAFFYYVIISLLNSLTGTRLLMLDELSVMDSRVFKEFLSLVKSHEDEFDTVILSAVDHPDTVKAVEDAGIEKIMVSEEDEDELPLSLDDEEEETTPFPADKETPDFLKVPDTDEEFIFI